MSAPSVTSELRRNPDQDGDGVGVPLSAGELPAAAPLGIAAEVEDWAARALVACRPVTVTPMALSAAANHSVTAAAAVKVPGWTVSCPS